MKKYCFVDLFAGAGGLSEGFIRAGFKPVAHIEVLKDAALTLKTRMAYHFLIEEYSENIYFNYLRNKLTRDDLYNHIPTLILDTVLNWEINENSFQILSSAIKKKLNHEEVDVLIGGPPCQAYSLIGRARDPNNKRNDPKNLLYKQYVKFLREFKPKVLVFENVPGLLSAGNSEYYQDLLSLLGESGYIIEEKILNSLNFGVMQSRKRVIIIGWRSDLNFTFPDIHERSNTFCIKDLFEDLPFLEPGETNNNYISGINNCLSRLKIRRKNDILTQNFTRSINKNDRMIYKIAIKKWNEEKKRLIYTEIPKYLRTHNNEKSFKDRFKVVDGDGSCHTIVAHISKDGHYYIHPDLKQARSLTLREAARIQSFPDDYYFEGSRTSVLSQIGNAVPVLMAEKIAEKIMELLR